MSWSLVEFGSPVVATADHPVVVWPPSDQGRPAEPVVASKVGIGNLLEVRFPVGPTTTVLMTWRDQPDPPNPISGKTHHAENLNAFTIAEAEKQWFHKPGTRRPRQRSGNWMPLSLELIPGYSIREAAYSDRRQRIIAALNDRLGEAIEKSLRAEIRHIPGARDEPIQQAAP
jgi:hypothetical protein